MSAGSYCFDLYDEERHILDWFDCGHDDNSLGNWLANAGRRDHANGMCRIHLMFDGKDMATPIGYYSLSSHTITSSDIPRKMRGGAYGGERQLPAQLLGKFAVHKDVQGGDAGRELMRNVFETYLEVADRMGARFLVLHVRNQRLIEYYMRFGFRTVNQNMMAMTRDAVAALIAAQ